MEMVCTKACFAKSCGNEDPDQAVISDAAGDVESKSGSEGEDGDNEEKLISLSYLITFINERKMKTASKNLSFFRFYSRLSC